MEKSGPGPEYLAGLKEKYGITPEEIEQLSDDQRFSVWANRHEKISDGVFRVTSSEIYKDLDTAFYPSKFEGRKDIFGPYAHHKIKKGLHKFGERLFPEGDFTRMVEALKAEKDLLGDIKKLLKDQKTTLIPTDHPWLMNGAVAAGALYCALDDWRIAKNSAYIINKMTGWLEVVIGHGSDGQPITIPVIGTVQEFCGVACCVPDSDSVKDLGLTKFGESYNLKMMRPVLRKAREGIILHANPSGSLDLVDHDEHGQISSITMKRVMPTTAKLLSGNTEAALPIVMWQTPRPDGTNKLSFKFDNTLVGISSEEDIHSIMEGMRSPYYELVSEATKSEHVKIQYQRQLAA